MNEKNFVFLGTNNLKNNAFFVNKDYEQLFKKVILEKNIELKILLIINFKKVETRMVI